MEGQVERIDGGQVSGDVMSLEEFKRLLSVETIYKLAMMVRYGDENTKRAAVDFLLQVTPDELMFELIRRYVDRSVKRYWMVREVVGDVLFGRRPSRQGDAGEVPDKVELRDVPEELRQVLRGQ